MKKILIVNPKGGCGKTTLATNLASYYALWGVPVALIDCDSQQSSMAWLSQRDAKWNPIYGVDGSEGDINVPLDTKRIVIDIPARTSSEQVQKLFRLADVLVMPVLPSPIDMRAVGDFIEHLQARDLLRAARIGLVGNRVREHTRIFDELRRFLKRADIPFITHLRDTQNYIRAAAEGFGVFEMAAHQADKDMTQWRPLIRWIEKRR